MTNRELIEAYPWLTPTNRWSGKRITDCMGENGDEGYWPGNLSAHPNYDYEYTELDEMPLGWRRAFGEEMCAELDGEIKTWPQDMQDEFRIFQIKEKWGSLRFYTNYTSKEFKRILRKYKNLSETTCINCGEPAKWISRDWISPYCDICAQEDFDHINGSYSAQTPWEEKYIDINEYLSEKE